MIAVTRKTLKWVSVFIERKGCCGLLSITLYVLISSPLAPTFRHWTYLVLCATTLVRQTGFSLFRLSHLSFSCSRPPLWLTVEGG